MTKKQRQNCSVAVFYIPLASYLLNGNRDDNELTT